MAEESRVSKINQCKLKLTIRQEGTLHNQVGTLGVAQYVASLPILHSYQHEEALREYYDHCDGFNHLQFQDIFL